MMDVLCKCEDVRDHVNQLCQLATRTSGFMGTGWQEGDVGLLARVIVQAR